MGDRANIVVQEPQALGGNMIYLYTHWGGSELPGILQAALKRGRSRWQDSPYLTRIIFSEMIQDSVLDETGFGISTTPTDNEYPYLVVDVDSQEVRSEPEGRGRRSWRHETALQPLVLQPLLEGARRRWTFDEFCNLDLSNDPRY